MENKLPINNSKYLCFLLNQNNLYKTSIISIINCTSYYTYTNKEYDRDDMRYYVINVWPRGNKRHYERLTLKYLRVLPPKKLHGNV